VFYISAQSIQVKKFILDFLEKFQRCNETNNLEDRQQTEHAERHINRHVVFISHIFETALERNLANSGESFTQYNMTITDGQAQKKISSSVKNEIRSLLLPLRKHAEVPTSRPRMNDDN
jgi:hypothetical protein